MTAPGAASAPERFAAALGASPLCAGIDPHASELAAWGLPDTAAGAREFSMRILDAAVSGGVRVVKPQVAFFERFGSAGFAVLEEVLAAAASAGAFTVADAKRGDIGSTMAGYAAAWCDPASPLRADAVTLSPFLGFGSLAPALSACEEHDAMAFVLALTSNPDGASVQHAVAPDGDAVAAEIVAAAERTASGSGRIGLVVGATTGEAAERLGIDLAAFPGPILTPGYGAQGASADDLRRVFGDAGRERRLLVNASRGISSAGPDAASLTKRIEDLTFDLRTGLRID